MMNLKGLAISGVLAATVSFGFPAFVNAQQPQEPVRTERRSEGFDLGWLGLLGLIGLFGLKRREHEHDTLAGRDRVVPGTR